MCMVLGLDPCLYLKKESEINVEEKQIIISELVELFELSESENIKFLYNGFFDYNNTYGVKNLINNQFVSNELFEFLKQIIDIRNEHAHIKAMSLEKFQELNDLLFISESNIKKLLDMKKEIKNKIDTNS